MTSHCRPSPIYWSKYTQLREKRDGGDFFLKKMKKKQEVEKESGENLQSDGVGGEGGEWTLVATEKRTWRERKTTLPQSKKTSHFNLWCYWTWLYSQYFGRKFTFKNLSFNRNNNTYKMWHKCISPEGIFTSLPSIPSDISLDVPSISTKSREI